MSKNGFGELSNFRDVGYSINQYTGTAVLREERLFRSARARNMTEHINAAKKRNAAVASSAAIPQSSDSITEPVKLPNVTYHTINLNGGAFERALLWKLSWSNIGRVCYRMAAGYRNEAISILGQNVMSPRGLTGLACDTLTHSTAEIRAVFDILSTASNYPILIHCTQGKDRTGLLVLLVLALLDVDERSISYDYARSEKELLPELEERMREIKSIGLTEEFAGCPPDFVPKVMAFLRESYGGVEAYLSQLGFDEEAQQRVVKILHCQ
ncbi:MAG: hypothetical protein Q9227_003292 [Pyrenula ochraceoflavens]